MAVQVTCKHCKNKVDKEKAKNPKPRLYFCCEECYNKYVIEQKNKELDKKTIRGGGEKTQEQEDRLELIDYIYRNIYNKNVPIVVYKQIKKFHEEKGYKYKGMLLTLQYYFEIEGRPVDPDYGIGIIEWYYDKACEYYKEKIRIRKLINSTDMEDEIVKVRPIKRDVIKKYKLEG